MPARIRTRRPAPRSAEDDSHSPAPSDRNKGHQGDGEAASSILFINPAHPEFSGIGAILHQPVYWDRAAFRRLMVSARFPARR